MSAGLLPLLLLESSLEKTERDGEKGTDWISWGKMLREPEFFINQLIYGSKSAVEAVASTGSRFSSLTPPLHPPSPPTATWWSWPLTSAETETASKVWRVSFFSTSSVAREERKWAFLLLEVWNYYFPRLPNYESRMSLLFFTSRNPNSCIQIRGFDFLFFYFLVPGKNKRLINRTYRPGSGSGRTSMSVLSSLLPPVDKQPAPPNLNY